MVRITRGQLAVCLLVIALCLAVLASLGDECEGLSGRRLALCERQAHP